MFLVINMFFCSVICIWRLIADTISSLAMSAFVCSVKSYSEVRSRNYLIASDKRVHLAFGSWFRTPKKEQKPGEKVFEKSSFQVRAGPIKMTVTRQA